jgi:hypothetical protein
LDSDDADQKAIRSAPFNFKEPGMTRNSSLAASLATAAIAVLFSIQYIGSAAPVEVIVTGLTAGESNDAAGSPSPTAP